MDNNIKHISNDIRSKRQLEENIPKLLNLLADYYHTYAGVRLAMHYYSFYETYCDDESLWSRDAQETTEKLNHIIMGHILKNVSGKEHEEAIRAVDAIRKDIMKRMDILTSYTDVFQIYEYVFNRVEYRYNKELPEISDDELAKEILRFIFDSEDNLIINERIKDIIGQLPVRMTRQRYFDLLKESIRAYLGADQDSLDSYLYMLRTSAMLQKEEGMETYYPGLWEKKEQLSHMDFKQIPQQDYEKAKNILQAAVLTLETEITVFIGLQEIVNEIYSLLLTAPYEGMVNSEFDIAGKASIHIIGTVNEYFINHNKEELSDTATQKLTDLEGVQEEMSYPISLMEDALYEINLNHQAFTGSLMLSQFLKTLLRSQSLLSNSMFIDLEMEEKGHETVDEELAEKEAQTLESELTSLFDVSDRMVVRAVIANTINKMPVFFSDHKEVMDYVRYSLDRCSDIYEKAACYEIINEIMSE